MDQETKESEDKTPTVKITFSGGATITGDIAMLRPFERFDADWNGVDERKPIDLYHGIKPDVADCKIINIKFDTPTKND